MAEIGTLEGSEEDGVDDVPRPEQMIGTVHELRGGALFGLSLVAPLIVETGDVARKLRSASSAIHDLGTAFQMVDDLIDFESDLARRSNNPLVSQIIHGGSDEERSLLTSLTRHKRLCRESVGQDFRDSALVVLDMAYDRALSAITRLHALGHWLMPDVTETFIRARVGDDGIVRMSYLSPARLDDVSTGGSLVS